MVWDTDTPTSGVVSVNALARLDLPAPEGADTITTRARDPVMSRLTAATTLIRNKNRLLNRAGYHDLCHALRLLDILDLLTHLLYQDLKVDTGSRHGWVG